MGFFDQKPPSEPSGWEVAHMSADERLGVAIKRLREIDMLLRDAQHHLSIVAIGFGGEAAEELKSVGDHIRRARGICSL